MLSIQSSQSSKPLVPNLLPCKVAHSGPLQISKRHWNPQPSSAPVSHLRGRKLRGRVVKLPPGYQGVLAKNTERILPQTRKPSAEDEEEPMDEPEVEEELEVKMMETKATFEGIVVWGHEAVPGAEDEFVKGIEEWIGFADSIHAYDMPGGS